MRKPRVEIEEDVYVHRPADNGSGPMWCHGSTCILRVGSEVTASGMETLPGARPLNNCMSTLWRRTADGWRETWRHGGRTREPAPMACFADGRVFVSLNPTLAAPDAYDGPAEPLIAEFASVAATSPQMLRPQWDGAPDFTEHSYRSFASDGARGELVLFQNVGMSHVEFAFLDSTGAWASRGRLAWPWGAEYDQPQPVRICYPTVQLRDRGAWFCGVSDIEEPYGAWRAAKRELAGREWDYDFRRLFFTWSDDIGSGRFHPWMELASRDRTCGWIGPRDLLVDDAGLAHILWSETAIDVRLREAFFPGERQSHCLHYAVIRDGVVLLRRALHVGEEGGEQPGDARFHRTPDGRLFVLYALVDGRDRPRDLVREILPDGSFGEPADVPLELPLRQFFTAGARAGCEPSEVIDVLGQVANTVRYARVRLP